MQRENGPLDIKQDLSTYFFPSANVEPTWTALNKLLCTMNSADITSNLHGNSSAKTTPKLMEHSINTKLKMKVVLEARETRQRLESQD